MSAKRKPAHHCRLGSLFHPLIKKKTRNISEESASSCDIVFHALDVAENVTAKLDLIMERLEKLSLIESRLDSMAPTMANIESTLSRLDADVTVLKEEAGKRDKKVNELEKSINYTEKDVAEMQKDLYDHKVQLDKCKNDLLYLEAYSTRENVKIFGVPESTGSENASEPEDTKPIVYNFLEQELQIKNSRAKYEFQRVHRLGKPNPTSSRPIIVRFLRFTDKEEVMGEARNKIEGQGLFYVRRYPKRFIRPS